MMGSSPFKPISSVPRILIVRLSAHGDVIHTLPLLSTLRRHYPEAVIGWLVDSSAVSLIQDHPALNQVHVWPRRLKLSDLVKPWRWPAFYREVSRMVRELKAQQYELSLDPQGLLKSAIWPFLVGVPRRFGFQKTREWADWFYTDRLPPRPIRSANRLAADQSLDLARALGVQVDVPRFDGLPVSTQSREKVAQLLEKANPERLLVVLAPFTRWASKHWVPDAWVRLMQDLARMPLQVVIVGGHADRAAVDVMLSAVSGREQILNLAGQTDWPDLVALYERTALMIGLDSAPLHIANAVGTPRIIGIYGPTAAGRTGPIGEAHTVLQAQLPCQPCFSKTCRIQTHDCMTQITPEQVLAAVQQWLQPYLDSPLEVKS